MSEIDHGTRDMALRAFTTIENHIASCDRRYIEFSQQQEKTLRYLQELLKDIGGLKEQAAEMRGAGKMAKALWVAGTGTMGFLGGLASHVKF